MKCPSPAFPSPFRYKMSYNINVMSASMAEMMEGAARSMNGECGADMMRRQQFSFGDDLSAKALEKKVVDYYYRACLIKNELKQAHGFKQCEDHFEGIYKARLRVNSEEMRKAHAKGNPMAIVVLPCQFMIKQAPTDEQRQSWIKRWDDDGDLDIAFKRFVPDGIAIPFLNMGIDTDMPVQLAVVLISVDKVILEALRADRSASTMPIAAGGAEGDPTAPAADGEDEFPSIAVKKAKRGRKE